MTAPLFKQLPLDPSGIGKTDSRTQFAALCYKVEGKKLRFLLITSRASGRWIIPKGWPMPGLDPLECVRREAWEEAGIKGTVMPRPLGLFTYLKNMGRSDDLPCVAITYAMEVDKLARIYPEAGQRKRKWMSGKKAAKRLESPELAAIIKDFDPGDYRT